MVLKMYVIAVISCLFLSLPGEARRLKNRGSHNDGPVECQMPPYSELEKSLSTTKDLHSSFYQFPPLLDTVTTLPKFMKENKNMTKFQFSSLNPHSSGCQNIENNISWDPCPLVWKFNHDENRVPETLLEAECLKCSSCSLLKSDDLGIGCAPIQYYTKVLRRKRNCHPQTQYYTYVEVWEPLTVGCACRGGVAVRASEENPLPPNVFTE